MESRIQCSGLHLKHISGSQTQSLDNAISMLRSPLQRLQNEHVECSLQQLNPVFILVFLVHRCRHSTRIGSRVSTPRHGGPSTGGIPLFSLPTKWSTVHTPNSRNSGRVQTVAYNSRIAVTGFRCIALCAGR